MSQPDIPTNPLTWQSVAERIGQFLENKGMSGAPGRLLGWLLVCQPAHQSATELANGLQLSRGSVSMAVNSLQVAGAVERIKLPGQRATYYRMKQGFWLNEATSKAQLARQWSHLADQGITELRQVPDFDTGRLEETRDVYEFLAEQYESIDQLWQERQRDRSAT